MRWQDTSSGRVVATAVGGAGVTRVTPDFGLRTAPSVRALYPVETYLVVHSVEGIEPGVYHYAFETHELDQLQVGDFRAELARAALDATVLCYQSSS